MIRSSKYQQGVTLAELMVGLVVGLIVIAGVLQVYLTTIGTSGDTLKSSHLNQELSAIMNIMAGDIRRAGYANATAADWDCPAPCSDPDDLPNFLEPTTNPFNLPGLSALEVHDNQSSDTDQAPPTGSGSCIVYAYDANDNGKLFDNSTTPTYDDADETDSFGFRFDAADNEVDMRTSIADSSGDSDGNATNSCAAGYWEAISDGDTVEITALTFAFGDGAANPLVDSKCLNTSEPDGEDEDGDGSIDEADEFDCYTNAADSGETTVEVRNITITLSGRLVDDPLVNMTLTQTIRVRNNLVTNTP